MPPMNALHQQKENNFLFRTKTPAGNLTGYKQKKKLLVTSKKN